MRAWSLYMNVGDNAYPGHSGYADVLGSVYCYDSAVANHRRVAAGDLIVLRNEFGSLGVGFIERIDEELGTKNRRRCPECNTSQLERRTTIAPAFRCTNGHVFAEPVAAEEPMTLYRAQCARGYVEFESLGRDKLESLCLAKSRQNAIRELDLDRTLAALREYEVFPGFVGGSA
jgi:hypothetical protein